MRNEPDFVNREASDDATLHLSLPVSTTIIGYDTVAQSEQNVQLAREFTPLSQKKMQELTAKVAPVSKQSLFFRFYERA